MRAHGQITERDFLAAQFLNMRPRLLYVWVPILLLCLGAAIVSRSVPLIVAIVVFVLYFALFAPWRARRTFREYKALSESFSMEVRDEGLFFERENSSGMVPWSHVVKWRATDSLAVLYPARNVFYVVPSHCFPNQKDFGKFRDTLTERVGKAT